MRLNNEILFTFIKHDDTRVPIANSDIGNLDAFEISYEVELLDSSPLVSTNVLYFQEDAMEIILDYFNKHRAYLYLEIDHPEIGAIKYLVDKASIKLRDSYVEASLVIANLYNRLADQKDVKYDVDLNSIPKHRIELPEVQGINRLLFYGSGETKVFDTLSDSYEMAYVEGWETPYFGPNNPMVYSTGFQALPCTVYKTDLVNKNVIEVETLTIDYPIISPPGAFNMYVGREVTWHTFHNLIIDTTGLERQGKHLAGKIYEAGGWHNLYLLRNYKNDEPINNLNLSIKTKTPNFNVRMQVLATRRYTTGSRIAFRIEKRVVKLRLLVYKVKKSTLFPEYPLEYIQDYEVVDEFNFEQVNNTKLVFDTTGRQALVANIPVSFNLQNDSSFHQVLLRGGDTETEYYAIRPEFLVELHISNYVRSGDASNIDQLGLQIAELNFTKPFLMDVTFEAPFKTREVFAYKPVDLITAGLKQMASEEQFDISNFSVNIDNIDSNYPDKTGTDDEDLRYKKYDLMLIPAESYKNQSKKVYYFKLVDIIKMYYGLGYQLFSDETSISFKKRVNTDALKLTNLEPSDFDINYSKVLLNSIEIGYNLDEASTSTIDPHRRVTYKSLVNHKAETVSKLLPYRGDAVGLMKILDDNTPDVDSSDYWWEYFAEPMVTVNSQVDGADTTVFMLITKARDGDDPIATTDGTDPSIARLNIFNWQISTPALMYYLADYLKYSGNYYELVSSFGMRDFSVQMFPYTGSPKHAVSDFFQVMAGPVLSLSELTYRVTDSKESYGGLELSTSVVLTPTQIKNIIEANASMQNVHIELENLGVSGLLLSAKLSLVFQKASEIVMLIDQSFNNYNTPSMLVNTVVPYSKTIKKPGAIYPSTTIDYYLFYNTALHGIELLYRVTQLNGPAGQNIVPHIKLTEIDYSTVPTNSSPLFNKTILITLKDLGTLEVGTYTLELTVQNHLTGHDTFIHKLTITE